MSRKNSLTSYANYLRRNIKTPQDWDEKKFGVFPGTPTMLKKYFGTILKENKNKIKINAIERRFNTKSYSDINKKISVIDGKPRSIINFFKGSSTPTEQNIDFIATVFDAPLRNFDAYIEFLSKGRTEIIETKTANNLKSVVSNFYIRNKTISISILIFVILLSIYPLSKLFSNSSEYNIKDNINLHNSEHAGFFPDELNSNFVEHNYEAKDLPPTNTELHDTVLMHTINIFNDKCIYKDGNWSFPVDVNGEDMNSNFGRPFNEDIKIPNNGNITLANQLMDIHFNIENKFNKQLFFSSMKLTVDTSFSITAENAEYHLYTSRGNELVYEITLDTQSMQGFTANKEEISAGGALFCRLSIKGTPDLNNTICRFTLTTTFSDVSGNIYTAVSDKKYYIAFLDKN